MHIVRERADEVIYSKGLCYLAEQTLRSLPKEKSRADPWEKNKNKQKTNKGTTTTTKTIEVSVKENTNVWELATPSIAFPGYSNTHYKRLSLLDKKMPNQERWKRRKREESNSLLHYCFS